MTSTERWLNSRKASRDVIELLENARAPRPLDAATRERSRRRLAAIASVPAAAGAMFWLQNVAFGALLGAAAGGAVLAPEWLQSSSTAGPERAIVPSKTAPAARPEASAPSQVPMGQAAHEAPSAEPPPSRVVTPGAPSSARDLTYEARLLEQARSLLGTNPSGALRALQRHEQEFGAGTLLLEREFLRIEALVRLGRTREAHERAQALRSRAPGHLYEQRLKSLLGASF